MKEVLELRINNKYIGLLPASISGNNLGPVTKVKIEKNSGDFQILKEISETIKAKGSEKFFYGWGIRRFYSKKDFENVKLFHLIISNVFEPAGEECGTLYDETTACEICGANRKQLSPLTLKKGSIPKKDIAKTIAGEVVVSKKFEEAFGNRELEGLVLEPVTLYKSRSNFYQLIASTQVGLSQNTVVGLNPFDLSTSSGNEIYKCPKGHTIGLNLLSEPHVLNSPSIQKYDFFASKEKIGVKRGLLQPESIYFCSSNFKKMIEEEKLSGFDFEIANIE